MSLKSKRLGSLADIFQSEILDGTIRKIKLSKIIPSERQPRNERKKGIEELAESIRVEGLLQPIIVTKADQQGENYKIIAGERRFHAISLLGWPEVECRILNKDTKETYKLAVVENLLRENLSPYEEVEAMKILKEEYKYTDSDLGNIFGKSRNYISEILSIFNLTRQELDTCRQSGIESKNLLVQAAQAAKKGEFQPFLQKVQSGELKTVKDAKLFNKEAKETRIQQEPEKRNFKRKALTISSDADSIIIRIEIPEKKEEILKKIEKTLKKYL